MPKLHRSNQVTRSLKRDGGSVCSSASVCQSIQKWPCLGNAIQEELRGGGVGGGGGGSW